MSTPLGDASRSKNGEKMCTNRPPVPSVTTTKKSKNPKSSVRSPLNADQRKSKSKTAKTAVEGTREAVPERPSRQLPSDRDCINENTEDFEGDNSSLLEPKILANPEIHSKQSGAPQNEYLTQSQPKSSAQNLNYRINSGKRTKLTQRCSSSGVTRSTSGMAVIGIGSTANTKHTVAVNSSVKMHENDEDYKSSPNTHRSSLNGSGFSSQVLNFMARAQEEAQA